MKERVIKAKVVSVKVRLQRCDVELKGENGEMITTSGLAADAKQWKDALLRGKVITIKIKGNPKYLVYRGNRFYPIKDES